MNHLDIHFSFVQFLKTLPVLLKVSASRNFFSSASQIRCTLKKQKKKIPTRSSATRKDPISKVTYLKRGHLCKKSQLQSRDVQIVWSFPINKHNTVRGKERKPTQHNSICMCFIKKYILYL